MRRPMPHNRRLARRVLAVALAAGLSSALSAQTPSAPLAYLENDTESTLYLAEQGNAYRQLPVAGLMPISPGARLEGFAYDRTSLQLPTLTVDTSGVDDGSVLAVRTDDLSLVTTVDSADVARTISGPRLDNRYLDWISVEPLFARAHGRSPLGAFRDRGDGRETISADDSLLWERAGTDLEWLKTERVGNDLFLAASAYSLFVRNTVLNLYIYAEGDLPAAAIEIDADQDHGLVLMRMPLLPAPVVVGNSVAGEFFLEAQIWLDVLADQLALNTPAGEVLAGILMASASLDGAEADAGRNGNDVTVEVATASSAAGTWEEFVLARVALSLLVDK